MRGPALFTQISVSRALRAVKKSGVAARIEIGRNGAISIIPTNDPTPAEPAADKISSPTSDWDAAIASGLKYLHTYYDRHGKLRHAFRRRRFKTVPLPGLPGSVELMQAYTNALAGVTAAPQVEIGASRSGTGSVAAAVALYFGSMAFDSLAPATQRNRRWTLENLREHYGDQSFSELQREQLNACSGAPSRAQLP
jgi:hypothetical protein